jgi:ABC-2 type transport system permease protein
MKTILYMVQKEFLQISRDKFLRTALIVMPIMQMLVLVYATTFEMKHIRIAYVDQDRSTSSNELINKINGSKFFISSGVAQNMKQAEDLMTSGKANVICVLPYQFGRNITTMQPTQVQLLINSIDGSAAGLSLAYCNAVIMSYSKEKLLEKGLISLNVPQINTQTRHWYNPELNYKIYMAPGILVILVTVIGWLMAGMNMVKEKERGTIEQLNVTPIQKYQFIAGKLIPFLIIGLFDLAFGLVIARLLFKVPIEGSLLTLFSFGSIYLVAVLGIGLLISTISNTQQQVLFVSFFFVMIFIMMSGLFTAVENMPQWGQILNRINPAAYFIRVIRMVLLKGSGFADIKLEFMAISIYAIIINSLAVWRYRKIA